MLISNKIHYFRNFLQQKYILFLNDIYILIEIISKITYLCSQYYRIQESNESIKLHSHSDTGSR